jgi:hypothetical protein
MRARFLLAFGAAVACGEKPATTREPASVPVKPPPEETVGDDDEDEDTPVPERTAANADPNEVWKVDEHVCVNEAGTDPDSSVAFAGCRTSPKRELVSRDDLDMPCGRWCGYQLDESVSNSQRATGRRSACCFAALLPRPVPGRPLRDGDTIVTAPAIASAAWIARLRGELIVPEPEVAAQLAEEWSADGALEHASVASFAKLTLDLMTLGAPPELLARASQAALDEIEHARSCFALASAYAGKPIGPGPLPVPERQPVSVEELAKEVFVDGCVGETRNAVEARVASESARDPLVRELLERIARDEEEHAELAWRVLAWLVARRPELGARLERWAEELERHSRTERAPEATLAEHGRIDGETRDALQRATLAQIVRPCVRQTPRSA